MLFVLFAACTDAAPAPGDTGEPSTGHDPVDSADSADTDSAGDSGDSGPGDSGDSGDSGGCGVPWYADDDGDGYGGAALGDPCSPPAGAVDVGGDCDDTWAGVNPGASEHCNGVDDDCNGVVDDNATDAVSLYEDADGDGYGDAPLLACPGDGRVADGGDCEDADAAIHPGATEVCEDGVDQDCTGADRSCFTGGTKDVSTDATSWQGDEQWFGYSVGTAGDVDGDGVDDLFVHSYVTSHASGGGGGSGTYYVSAIYGGSFVVGGDYDATTLPVRTVDGAVGSMDASGDFDGDGTNDLVMIGALTSLDTGVQLEYGGGRWAGTGTFTPDVEVFGSMSTAYAGTALEVGDHDGDGLDDALCQRSHGVFLLYGDPALIDTAVSDWSSIQDTDTNFSEGRPTLADFDADGLDDVALPDYLLGYTGADYPGGVHILYSTGRLSGDLSVPGDQDATLHGPAGVGPVGMGYTTTAGDFNGDGYTDLVATGHMYGGKGKLWLFDGGAARWAGDVLDTAASGTVESGAVSSFAVNAVRSADLDLDGTDDLLVSATNTALYLYLGRDLHGAALDETDFAGALAGAPASSGMALRAASGDLDGDGIPDQIASAYAAYGTYGDGVLWVLPGSIW